MNESIMAKWNRNYRQSADDIPKPALVLREFAHLLPPRGNALDVACGLGGNAIFLAQRGLDTLAFDISSIAIDKLREFSCRLGLDLQLMVEDIDIFNWEEKHFDVILISRFLDRRFTRRITGSLKPGGLLFYQTFIREKSFDSGPNNPDYLLMENELLRLFGSLTLLAYREEGRVGDTNKGLRNEAFLVAQRRN